jgi:hypothetical protein
MDQGHPLSQKSLLMMYLTIYQKSYRRKGNFKSLRALGYIEGTKTAVSIPDGVFAGLSVVF